MNDQELLNIWKSYDQKIEEVIVINKEIAYDITKKKLNTSIQSLRLPKSLLLMLGIPYTLIMCFITWVTYKAAAYIMMFGFGTISLIMIGTIIGYFYQFYLISKISRSEEIMEVQESIAELKLSSYNIARLIITQLPCWSICWVSMEGVKNSPFIYGGINLMVFIALSYLSYWLYQDLSIDKHNSKISKIIFSGKEWEPIIKSSNILKQLKEYKKSC